MDPITLIVAALAAGAVTGVTDVGNEAVKDAYAMLKRLATRCLSKHEGPVQPAALVAAHNAQPEVYRAPLEAELRSAGAEADAELVAAAGRLMALADPEGTVSGKYHVDLRGATGVQVGDHGTMTVNLAPRPEHGRCRRGPGA